MFKLLEAKFKANLVCKVNCKLFSYIRILDHTENIPVVVMRNTHYINTYKQHKLLKNKQSPLAKCLSDN